MLFCLNCRVFGEKTVDPHGVGCAEPMIVQLEAKVIAHLCSGCGKYVDYTDRGPPPVKCGCKSGTESLGVWFVPIYEYPKELRRS